MKDTQEIDLKDIWNTIKMNWFWLLIIPVLCSFITFLYFSRLPDEYTAQTKLYVFLDYTDNLGQLRYDTSASTEFTGDFKELIKTEPVYRETANRLGSDMDVMKNVKVDVSEVSGTRVIVVNATSTSPSLSLNVANTISQVFVEYITKLMKKEAVSIAAEASLPTGPSGPARVKTSLQVGLIALALVFIIMIVLRILNTKLSTIDDIEGYLKTPVLAGIPDYRDEVAHFMKESKPNAMLGSAVADTTMEGVRTLATNIQFAYNKEMRGTTLMVTSTTMVEGKSTLVLLLAEALVDDGFNVLVCDFDVKRPSIGQYIGTRNRRDIIDYLSGRATLSQIATKTPNKGVYFVDFYHRNYSLSQIVKHPGFTDFLDDAAQYFNVVLFDTCPLGMFIDAAILSTNVNGTLMVVGSGMVERHRAMDVMEQLKKANANILGVALNFTSQETGGRYYYDKRRSGRKKDKKFLSRTKEVKTNGKPTNDDERKPTDNTPLPEKLA